MTSAVVVSRSHSWATFRKSIPYIVIGLIVIIGAFMVYAILVGPSKQPYRDALAEYKNVYNANVAFTNSGSALNASQATQQEFSAHIARARTSLKALTTENQALGKQSVLKNGQGKTLYDAFTKKLTDYATYNANILTSIEKVRPVVYGCSQTMATVSETNGGVQAIQGCSAQLATVEDVPDADYKTLVTTFKSNYDDFATVLTNMAALPDPKGADAAQYQAYTNQRTTILDNLNIASTTLSQDLQTHRNTVDITDTAKALDDYLSAKASFL